MIILNLLYTVLNATNEFPNKGFWVHLPNAESIRYVPGALRAGEGYVDKEVWDEPFQGNVVRPHQHPLVQEEEELLKRLEERPLGQQTDAL